MVNYHLSNGNFDQYGKFVKWLNSNHLVILNFSFSKTTSNGNSLNGKQFINGNLEKVKWYE